MRQLQDKVKELITQNERLNSDLNQAKTVIEKLNIQLKCAKNKIAQYEAQVQILQIQSKKRRLSESNNDPPPIQSKQSYIIQLGCPEYCQILKLKKEKMFKFVPEVFNNTIFFSINGPRITHLQSYNNFHQVVSKYPLNTKQTSIVGMRTNKSRKNNIYFGILREQRRKDKYTCQQQFAISYKLSGGMCLYEDGTQLKENLMEIPVGQILHLLIDPIKYEMVWFVEGVFMIRRELPSTFRKKALYVFVSLHDSGDEVEFI